jgi:hypothetical protein
MYRRPNGWKEVSQEEITAWVERYRASSLGLQRFARENGLSIQRLRYWVYGRPGEKTSEPETDVTAVGVAPVFQEIKLPASLPQQSWSKPFDDHAKLISSHADFRGLGTHRHAPRVQRSLYLSAISIGRGNSSFSQRIVNQPTFAWRVPLAHSSQPRDQAR